MNTQSFEHRPVLISHTLAKKKLGRGNTTYWKYVKLGLIKVVTPGPGCRSMAVNESVERLAALPADAAPQQAA